VSGSDHLTWRPGSVLGLVALQTEYHTATDTLEHYLKTNVSDMISIFSHTQLGIHTCPTLPYIAGSGMRDDQRENHGKWYELSEDRRGWRGGDYMLLS